MSDIPQDIIARASALLANVTPGVWKWERYEDFPPLYRVLTPDVISAIGYETEGIDISDVDAEFIAAAPQLVRDLVAEVTRLRVALVATVANVQAEANVISSEVHGGGAWAFAFLEAIKPALAVLPNSGESEGGDE